MRRHVAVAVSTSLLAGLLAATAVAGVAPAAAKTTPFTTPVTGAPLVEGLVTDGAGHAFATNWRRNQVEVLSLATGVLEAPIFVGSQPRGLDLSPDGKMLYVANSGANDISVVDVALRREVRRIAVPSYGASDRPFSIAVANTGIALVTTTFNGSGYGGRMLAIDLSTDSVTKRPDFYVYGQTSPYTRMRASGDRSRIGIVVGDLSSGAVFTYDAASDTFGPEKDLMGFRNYVALDGDGSTLIVDGIYVLDGGLVLRGTVPGGGGPAVLNPAGTMAYRAVSDAVEVIDVSRALVIGTIELPGAHLNSQVALAPDGVTLVVLTLTGIAVARTTDAVPVPCAPPPAPGRIIAVCGAPLAEVVVRDGYAYATNVARNEVEVISLATGALQTPILVGSQPRGLDFSPDGETLYVANSGSGDLSVVDVASRREVRRLTVPRATQPPASVINDRPFSVAVASSGTILLTTTFDGSGSTRMFSIHPATGVFRTRDDYGSPSERTRMRASGDRSKIGIVEGGNSSGPVWVYDAATDSFSAETRVSTFVGDIALDRTGGSMVVAPGVYLLDGGLALRATISAPGRAVAIDGNATVGYVADDSNVSVMDLGRGVVTRSIPLDDGLAWAMALTPDGRTLVVLTRNGVALVPTAPPQPKSLGAPATIWSQAAATPLDGLGGWVATGNDPTASVGQVAPSYLYAETFRFAGNSAAVGVVGLVTQPSGKYAAVLVVGPDGKSASAAVAFPWAAGHYYFPFVYQLSPGKLGAWVYDYTAGAWTGIGVLDVPVAWGKLAPTSGTIAHWFGEVATSCAAYPKADVYFYPPYGFVGTTPTLATVRTSATGPGDCPAENSVAFDVWAHYVLGA